jgi:enamine deaminase RidA (YjgF/YER057c/UK114 family)
MTIQRFETEPRMSQVVVHGDTIYLAGVVARTAAGESVTKQTQEVLSIIDSHLAKAGSDKSKLLTATIYLPDMKTFAEMNAVWDAWVSPGNTPARATVEAGLAAPQYGVEIMVTADVRGSIELWIRALRARLRQVSRVRCKAVANPTATPACQTG